MQLCPWISSKLWPVGWKLFFFCCCSRSDCPAVADLMVQFKRGASWVKAALHYVLLTLMQAMNTDATFHVLADWMRAALTSVSVRLQLTFFAELSENPSCKQTSSLQLFCTSRQLQMCNRSLYGAFVKPKSLVLCACLLACSSIKCQSCMKLHFYDSQTVPRSR